MSSYLIFSDLHLHNWPYGSTIGPDGLNSRLKVQRDFLDYIAEYVRKYNIETVIFCGDLVHTHGKLDVDVLDVALNGLKKISEAAIRCIALRGNHDMKSDKASISSLYDHTNWYYVEKQSVGPITAYLSYTEDTQTVKDFLSEVKLKQSQFVFMHQGVKGVPVGSGFEIPNEIFTENDVTPGSLFFTGHYHRHQQVNGGLVVIGSPMQHTWGDSGDDRGFIVIVDGKWKFRPYNAPRFVEIEAGTETADVQGNYVRVLLPKTISELDSYRKDLYSLGAKSVEFRVFTKQSKLQPIQIPNTDVLEIIIKTYEEKNKLDSNTINIGKQIRQGTYAPRKN